MKPHICTITVSPKKGETIETRWLVQQSIPLSEWTETGPNGQTTMANFCHVTATNRPASAPNIHCWLLRSDFTDEQVAQHISSRVAHAGYVEHQSNVAAPGTITYRGQDFGEMSITLQPQWADIKVRGFGTPSPGERDFIKTTIIPALRQFTDAHRDALKADAVQMIRERMQKEVSETRKALDLLETKIEEACNAA